MRHKFPYIIYAYYIHTFTHHKLNALELVDMHLAHTKRTVKKDFYLPVDIVKDAQELSKENGVSLAEFVRQALSEFIDAQKRSRLDKEIAEACVAYRKIDRELADEWRIAEGEIK